MLIAVILAVAACGGGGDGSGGLVAPGSGAPPAAAPEFPAGHTWFNVPEPVTLAELRGKAVLLDFWTLGCINCQHVVPDLKQLEEEFGTALVVVGVHSGKYDREQSDQSIRDAIRKFGVEHPVVNDPDFVIWNLYGAEAWPTTVLIDPDGNFVGYHQGEGVYRVLQPAIAGVIEEFDATGKVDRDPIALDLESDGAVSAILSFPSSVLADEASGRLFIADAGNNRVLISGIDGALQDRIGAGAEGLGDGSFEDATFRQPQGLALSADGGTLYIADTRNHIVRAADLQTRTVTTIAGTGSQLTTVPSGEAPATEQALASPWGLLLHERRLFIAMAGTHQIWTLDLDAARVAVFAGNRREGIDDGPRLNATLAQPSGLASDGTYLYWVDPESSSVRRVPLAGDANVETIVGTGLFDFGDVDGPRGTALLEHPQGVAYLDGVLYIADTYNHKIRAVDPNTGEVRTVAGVGFEGAIDGSADSARLNEPGGISAGATRLYVADTNNNAVRTVEVVAGSVATVSFSNLAVAVPGVEGGRSLRVALDPVTVGTSASTVTIRVSAPDGYHLNDLVESRLSLATSSEPSLTIQQDVVSFETSEPSVELSAPVQVGVGNAVLTVRGEVYYCRDGEEAICLIDAVDLAVPVTVAESSRENAVAIEYALPEVQT